MKTVTDRRLDTKFVKAKSKQYNTTLPTPTSLR